MDGESAASPEVFRRLGDLSVGRDPVLRQQAVEGALSLFVRLTTANSATFVHRPVNLFRLAPVSSRHPRISTGTQATSEQFDLAFKSARILASPDICPQGPDSPPEQAALSDSRGLMLLPIFWETRVVAVLALSRVPWINRLSRWREAACSKLFGILTKCVQEAPTPVCFGTTEMQNGKLALVLHRYAVPPFPAAPGLADPCPRILGQGAARRALVDQIVKVAPTEATVLILGETGTGKEVVARSIHENSPREKRPFVVLNLRGINENLMENELWGHEKGGYSGADAVHAGILEAAADGTVLLDEIGDLSLDSQAKLLAVLQDREFRRVGGTGIVRLKARLLLATRRDLGKLVKAGLFRDDLLFRLLQFPIELLPLRERREDIPPLISNFLLSCAQTLRLPAGFQPSIEPDAEALLVSLDWPGNVRELFAFLGFAVLSCMPEGISLAALRLLVPRWKRLTGESDGDPGLVERLGALLEAIRMTDGTTVGVADYLHISRQSSLEQFKRFRLQPRPGRRQGPRRGQGGAGGSEKPG